MTVSEFPTKGSREGRHTTALDQSALLDLLESLKAADAADVIRHALQAVLQALIEAEATAVWLERGPDSHGRGITRRSAQPGRCAWRWLRHG
ncbi:hypothetical protein Pmi06nite_77530 [Planotetraspora mira]|uniref:Transposase n=1 Tax=Planotetraspora mira TaxID=58121 RepID=A0A8J3XB82_9ACTN|nr:hypothetical protein Pmi06nite_77530 [Planotetraspora mira]